MREVTLVSTISLLMTATFRGTQGFHSGAPTSRCDNMTPHHGRHSPTPIDGKAPYSIKAEPYYHSGKVMEGVRLRNFYRHSLRIKGILLQARDANNRRVGTFVLKSSERRLKLIDCGGRNTSVTHYVKLQRYSIFVRWKAPSTDIGTIKFRATVVISYGIFYVGIESQAMSYNATMAGTAMMAYTGTTKGTALIESPAMSYKEGTAMMAYTGTTEGTAMLFNTSATSGGGSAAAPLPLSASVATVALSTLVIIGA